ncbi:RDD family protein [Micromonospora sp. NPDC051296]|uniref:RDD family protein n=1 Tax=Micromonospora sp. NPDC051296 TaxID=3155046 RepID=UPI00342E3FE7
MTQPPPHPTSPAGGPPPAAGGVVPPTSHPSPVPPPFAPPGQAPPGRAASPPPPGWAPGPYAPGRGSVAPPPVLGPGGQPLASFGDRLLAYLIDTVIASGVLVVLFLPVLLIVPLWLTSRVTRTNPDGTPAEPDLGAVFTHFLLPLLLLQAALFVLMLGLYWLYHVEYLKRTGQTFGKKAMNLRVVPLDPSGTLDRRMAGRRYLVQFVGGSLVPGGSYVDGFWQLWDKPWQQCLHDKFAGTVVVKVSR